MMKRKLNGLLLMLVLVALTFLLAGNAQAANFYKNSNYGFSFSYPDTWSKLDEDAMPGVLVAVLSEPVDDFSANFNVLATQREDASLTDKSEAIIEMYKTMVTDFDLLAREMGTIADEPCISIKYTCTQGTLELYMFQCILDHEDNTYIITFTASQSNYENYEDTFKEIIDSFSF